MVVEKIKTEPYNMEAGNVTTVKLTIFYTGDTPAPPKEEIIEINPVPFKDLGLVVGALAEHIRAKTELEELKEHYDSLKETCRRTHKEAEAILKHPSFAENAEKHRQEMEQSMNEEEERKRQAEAELPEKLIVIPEEKPAHIEKPEEKPEPVVQAPLPEPETPRQQAERIYDTIFSELKGKKVEKEDIMAAVMRAGIHTDDSQKVTEEIINLLKEKGAIPSPKGTLKRLLGGGKKKEKKKEGKK